MRAKVAKIQKPTDLTNLISNEATNAAPSIYANALRHAPFLQSSGGFESYFSNSLSDFYKKNDLIRSLEVVRHFYNPNIRNHFFSVIEDEHKLYGFTMYIHGFVGYHELVKEQHILDLECEEDTYPPRTLGDVFDAWEC